MHGYIHLYDNRHVKTADTEILISIWYVHGEIINISVNFNNNNTLFTKNIYCVCVYSTQHIISQVTWTIVFKSKPISC